MFLRGFFRIQSRSPGSGARHVVVPYEQCFPSSSLSSISSVNTWSSAVPESVVEHANRVQYPWRAKSHTRKDGTAVCHPQARSRRGLAIEEEIFMRCFPRETHGDPSRQAEDTYELFLTIHISTLLESKRNVCRETRPKLP